MADLGGGTSTSTMTITNPIGLARELEAERRKNKQLTALLESERQAREKAEALLLQATSVPGVRLSWQSDSSSNSERLAGEDGANGDSPSSMRTRETRLLIKLDVVKREKEVTEAALAEMKRQMQALQHDRERTAQKVEEEEDLLSNTLLRKLRLVTREKDTLELALSRSSRSSSLDHSCDSGSVGGSIAGSITSEHQSLKEADTRSEVSSMSNLACCRFAASSPPSPLPSPLPLLCATL